MNTSNTHYIMRGPHQNRLTRVRDAAVFTWWLCIGASSIAILVAVALVAYGLSPVPGL